MKKHVDRRCFLVVYVDLFRVFSFIVEWIEKLQQQHEGGKVTSIASTGQDGPYQKFILPEVRDWKMRLVVVV